MILALAILAPSWPPPPAAGELPPFGAGDWTVRGNETFSDRSVILAGDLVIQAGGSLTLSNASLSVFSSFPEEHQIRVRTGGTLRVLDGSQVNAFDPLKTFGFWLEPDSTAMFANSTFIACGIRYNEVSQQIVGGIISRTSLLTIENCTFAGAHIALTTYAPVHIGGTTFTGNYIGVIGISTGMDFSGCDFSVNTLIGVWAYTCVAKFQNCTFINNSIGVASDQSTCNLVGCRFARQSGNGLWASAMMHWFMNPSTFHVEDCLFEDNAIGIGHYPDVASNSLEIDNCDFLNNSLALDWENAGNTGNPAAGITFWNCTRHCLARNNRFLWNGNIRVGEGGSLDLAGSNLTFDCDFDGESGLLVEGGGRLELSNGSLVRMNWASRPYYLRCLPGSTFQMDSSVLRDCGYDYLTPSKAGPLFDGATVRIGSSVIDYNAVGLQFRNTTGAEVLGSAVRGLYTPVRLEGSRATVLNSTLAAASGPSVWLDNGSALECVNSTVDRGELRFDDNRSRLNLSWYLDVRARWADGSPAEGALVSVSDRAGAEVARERLGADGRLRGLALREVSLGLDVQSEFTPHTVNCSRGSVYNLTVQRMDQSRSLDILLEDRDPPSIDIAYPGPDQFLSSGTVFVNGTARDNLAVVQVELAVDGFRRHTAYRADGEGLPVAAWEATLALQEGTHTVEARSFDRAGNFASTTVAFTVDWSAPRIRIASPADGHLTNASMLAVSGYMEPGCRVLLGGYEVKTERDMFGGSVVLGEGDNAVVATAIDRAGNANSSTVRVRLDTRPPALEVAWPPDGFRADIPMVAVNGTMEPGASVTVNGRPLVLSGEPGTFRTAVALPREVNLIVVDAVDAAGNHNLTYRTVVLDTRPPMLVLESPPEGLVTNQSEVALSGMTEGGAVLTVDGAPSPVGGEPGAPARFAQMLRLSEGTNTIFVSAADAAGNLNYTVRHVVLDTQPPALHVSSPKSGQRTSQSSVFIIGETEPGALLTINSRPVAVGQTGSFSLDIRLAPGSNRITVRAADSAGNSNETAVEVQRLAAAGEDLVPSAVGPDWPFAGVMVMALAVAFVEGYLASRYFRKKAGV